MFRSVLRGAVVGSALLLLVVSPVRADRLDYEMKRRAPALLIKLQESKLKSLAILKFRIQDGDTPETYSDGALNTELGGLVTNELILAETNGKNLLLTAEAWSVATKAGINDYRSEASRKKLLDLTFAPAWGSGQIKPDAFLTGVLKVPGNRAKATLVFEMFTRAEPNKIKKVGEFSFASDRNLLADLGHSFQLVQRGKSSTTKSKVQTRGIFGKFLNLFDSEKDGESDATEEEELDVMEEDPNSGELIVVPDNQVETPGLEIIPVGGNPVGGEVTVPEPKTVDPSNVAGIKIEVLAGGTPLALPTESTTEQGTGPFQVQSPAAGTRVTFKLTNTTSETLAVLAMINGKNSIAVDEKESRKWIVEPGKTTVIPGRFMSLTDENNIQVLKIVEGTEAEEAKNNAEFVVPGKAGELEFQVFRKSSNPNEGGKVTTESIGMRARARSLPPSKYRGNLTSVQEAVAKKHLSKVESRSIKTPKGIMKREMVIPDTQALEKAKISEEEFPSSLQPDGSLVIKLTPR
jgi:hypothetical protein